MTRVADGVRRIECRGVNAYVVDDDVPTLVDAGTPWDESAIRAGLADAGYDAGDVGRVLLTHYDVDHVGTLAALAPELDCPVYAGGFDADVLAGRRSPPLTNHKGAFQRLTGFLVDRPNLDVVAVGDGESVGSFTAYHTPGHTPGHVAYVSTDLDVGLLGDLVRESGGELEASPWALSYDVREVRESVADLSARASAFDVACVGHGAPLSPDGSEKLRALAARIRAE